VKRREYQESFDRYCQFVEKNLPVNGSKKKNLWPPFRLPNTGHKVFNPSVGRIGNEPGNLTDEELDMIAGEKDKQINIDSELKQKENILNTKSLHAVLLTVLYEVLVKVFFLINRII